jgi:6-phosphofructokinase 1
MSKRRKTDSDSKMNPVPIDEVQVHEVPNLGVLLPEGHAHYDNTLICAKGQETGAGGYNKLIGDQEHILADIKRSHTSKRSVAAYVRGGPRKVSFWCRHCLTCSHTSMPRCPLLKIDRQEGYFNPATTNIAIVTCGGLCPGLNAVIYGIVKAATELYGVKTVYGIRGGYHGFYATGDLAGPLILTPKSVAGIQHRGGTILGAARGGFDLPKIITFLKEKSVSQLYVIGGDGTHRGLIKIYEETIKQGLQVAVVGGESTHHTQFFLPSICASKCSPPMHVAHETPSSMPP